MRNMEINEMTDEFDEYLRRNPMPTDIEDKNEIQLLC